MYLLPIISVLNPANRSWEYSNVSGRSCYLDQQQSFLYWFTTKCVGEWRIWSWEFKGFILIKIFWGLYVPVSHHPVLLPSFHVSLFLFFCFLSLSFFKLSLIFGALIPYQAMLLFNCRKTWRWKNRPSLVVWLFQALKLLWKMH